MKSKILLNFTFITVILISTIFWNISIYNFQLRFLILSLIVVNLIQFKKSDITFVYVAGIFTLLLFIHLLFALNFNSTNLSVKDVFYFLLTFIYLLIILKNFSLIIDNLEKIFSFFALFHNILFIISIFNNEILFTKYYHPFGPCEILKIRDNIIDKFYSEPSHYAMISSPVSIYLILNLKTMNSYQKCNTFLFIFFSIFFYLSATLVFTQIIVVIFIICIMIFAKELRNNFRLLLFYLIILLTIFTKIQCHSRVTGLVNADTILYYNLEANNTIPSSISSGDLEFLSAKLNFLEKVKNINEDKNLNEKLIYECLIIYEDNICQNFLNDGNIKFIKKEKELLLKKNKETINIIKNNSISVTTAVHANSLSLAIDTLKNKYIGYGFQKYESGYKLYMNKTRINEDYVKDLGLNFNDGASNFAKIIVEFGWFFIFFTLFFLYFLIFCKNIHFSIRLFLLAIIITQGVRGAGYYNGMFLFFVLLIVPPIYLNLQNYVKAK